MLLDCQSTRFKLYSYSPKPPEAIATIVVLPDENAGVATSALKIAGSEEKLAVTESIFSQPVMLLVTTLFTNGRQEFQQLLLYAQLVQLQQLKH